MARRRNQLLVPEAREGMERLKSRIISEQTGRPVRGAVDTKTEMARQAGVPYRAGGYNGNLKTEEAGKMGGPVGGQMVKELVKMAQEELARNKPKS
ncbi:small acid-soluble spore protein alpha/beta type [Melghirimyces profundicolus]|uniref:Small acid-soluble spore protein alpha/beta type n=1 Tax=Melghirimyces profundicolus TaxID=1242148 RepID=A0A2T6BC71_9BACL|nr:alpha/beta-type small acid-soluble spore protein [Melghirimyces profundicolus]PTX53659.1 small acid-soluble spore protein alpha/beta type [Melghirimyces profundicolus]